MDHTDAHDRDEFLHEFMCTAKKLSIINLVRLTILVELLSWGEYVKKLPAGLRAALLFLVLAAAALVIITIVRFELWWLSFWIGLIVSMLLIALLFAKL